MNIVLIGMRGSGKSTVGALLAQRLKKDFRELDAEVGELESMTIKEMVEKHGWDYFRDRETEIVKNAAGGDNTVISTGGGVVIRPENISALKQNGICVYLRTPLNLLLQRVGGEASKLPRLTNATSIAEEMSKVMEGRAPRYEAAADEIVDTEFHSSEQVVEEILRRLEKRHIA
jgi:shikimate kinase